MNALRSSYELHGVRVDVVSEDVEVTRQLASRLRRFACEPRRGPDILFEYVSWMGSESAGGDLRPPDARPVYDPPMGEVVYSDCEDRLYILLRDRLELVSDGRAGRVRTGMRAGLTENSWLASHPFFTLALLEQLKRRRLFPLHAALLSLGGRALVFPGSSGAGKSTLTLCLLRAGFAFGGDDLCFLRKTGGGLRVLAFPDELDVAEHTASFFPELQALRGRRHRTNARKWPLLPEEVYTVDFVSECAPSLLVFPQVSGSEESKLERLDPGEAMLELVPNVILTEPQASQEHLDALGLLVRQSRCLRLYTGRDFHRIPALLSEVLLA
jgi:hypothetical protein